MKFLLGLTLYLFSRAVWGAKFKESYNLDIEPLSYGPEGNFVKAGENIKINCKASSKNQKVEWYDSNGDLVKRNSGKRIFVHEQFVPSRSFARTPALALVFPQTQVDDSGIYECRSGELSQEIALCVIDPSEFVNYTKEVAVNQGRSISLTCQAKGDPEPRIMWYRHGELITDDYNPDKYTVGTKYNSQWVEGFLTVKSLEPDDDGEYICEALQENPLVDNCSNTMSLNVTLNVNYGPKFNSDQNAIKYIFGSYNESIDLVCDVHGYPPPTFRWFHEIDEILSELSHEKFTVSDDETQSTLTLRANESTFGQKYRCQATNRFGVAYKDFKIVQLEKPKKPSGIGVFNYTDSQIEFNVTWDEEVYPFPLHGFVIQYFTKKTGGTPREYQWRNARNVYMKFDETVVEMEEFRFILPELAKNTEYWIRLRLENRAGQSPWSIPVLASTDIDSEDVAIEVFDRIQVIDIQSNNDRTYCAIFIIVSLVIVGMACVYGIKKKP